jgi:NitT/TauT family transport system permease protein
MAMDEKYLRMMSDEILPAKSRKAWTYKLDNGMGGSGSLMIKYMRRLIGPILMFILFIGGWELLLTLLGTKTFIFPKPSTILLAAIEKWPNLSASVFTTILESILGFTFSIIIGVSAAVLLALSKTIEKIVYPYAIILQTIPIVAVAPIIVIWVGPGFYAIVVITFLIAFFPMLSNTIIGLNSTDHNMKNLFHLYGASQLQVMWKLRIPAALPYIVGGLKISCSLSVIGAIVGEYVAGIGGSRGGLGYAITVAASRLQTPYLFACGLAASALGIAFFMIVNAFSKWMLSSWHESEMRTEN